MSTTDKGYILPETNVQPEGFRCFCVYIPDDDFYQFAFFGAYEFFGTWLAWERDTAKRGALAAAAWREAIQRTRDSMGCDPIDYTSVFQNLVDAIGSISISQTVNCGCGCNGDETIGDSPGWYDDPVTDTGNPDDPFESPDPAQWPTPSAYASYKCSAANKLADDWIATVAKMGTLSGLVGSLGAAAVYALLNSTLLSGMVVGLMALGLTASGAIIALLGIFSLLLLSGGAALALFVDLANGYDKEALVCAFYQAQNVTDARTAFETELANTLDDLQGQNGYSEFAAKMAEIAGILMTDNTLAVLFNYEASVDGYSGDFDCTTCAPCGLFRELITGTGDLSGLGLRTLSSADENGGNALEFTLDGNYCITWDASLNDVAPTFYKCENDALVQVSIAEGEVGCAATVRFYHAGSPFTVDIDIIEQNPNCDCDPVISVFDFNDGLQGWYFEPRNQIDGWYHGEWSPDKGEGSTGALWSYMDSNNNTRSGTWIRDIESWGIIANTGNGVTARTRSLTLPGTLNMRIRIRFVDNSYDEVTYTQNASWNTITVNVSAGNNGKQVKSIELYTGQSGSVATGLSQVFDNVNLSGLPGIP